MATRQEKNLLNKTIGQINSSNVLSPRDKQILADALDRLSKSTVTSVVVRKKKINQTKNRKNLRFNTSNRTDCSTLSLQQCPEVEFSAYGGFVSSGACYDPVADPNDPYSNHESHCPKLCQFAPTGNWGAREGIGAWARWIEDEGRHENCQEATTTSNNPEIISSINASDVTNLWQLSNGISKLIIQGACIDEENQTCGPYVNADGDEINPCAEESPFAPDGAYILDNCQDGEIPSTHVYHYEDVCCANDISYCVIPCTGDLDLDGTLNVADIVMAVQNILGNNTLSDLQYCSGNTNPNQDTVINVVDIIKMVQVIIDGGVFVNDCEAPVSGCTDPNACNYNSQATVTNNSCQYQTALQDCTINNENCNTNYTEASETHDCNGVCINPEPCCGYSNWSEDCELSDGCGTPPGFDCSGINMCPDDGSLVCNNHQCLPKIICPDNITEVCDENDCPGIDNTTSPIFITQPDSPISFTTEDNINLIWEVSDDYTPNEDLQYWILSNNDGQVGNYGGFGGLDYLLGEGVNNITPAIIVGSFGSGPSLNVNADGIIQYGSSTLSAGTYYYQVIIMDNNFNFATSNIVQVSISQPPQVDIPGCTDPDATNYEEEANVDNGSCIYVDNSDFIQINNIGITDRLVVITGSITDVGDDYDGDYYVTIDWGDGNGFQPVSLYENLTFVVENTYDTYVTNQQITINLTGTDVSDSLTLTLDIPAPLQPDPISSSEKLYISDVSITDNNNDGTYQVSITAGYIDVDDIDEEYKIYIKFPNENDDGYYTYFSNNTLFTNNPSYQYSIPGEKQILVELENQDTYEIEDSLTITIDIPEPQQLPGEDLATDVYACNDIEACNYNSLCANPQINCTDDGNCYYPTLCADGITEACPENCPEIFGCTYSFATNYYCIDNDCPDGNLPDNVIDDGSCTFDLQEEPEPEPELPEAAIAQPFKLLEPDIITSNCTTPPYQPINGERVFCEAQGLINRILSPSPFLPKYGCSDVDFENNGNLDDATLIRLFGTEGGEKRIYFLWEEGDNTGNVDNFFITVQQGSDTILDDYEFYEPVTEGIDPTRSNRTTNAAGDINRDNDLHIGSFDNELGYSKIYYVSIPIGYFTYPDYAGGDWQAGDRIRWEVKLKVTGGDTIYGESACADFTPQSNHQANFYVADVDNNKIGCIDTNALNYNPAATTELNYNIENQNLLCRYDTISEPLFQRCGAIPNCDFENYTNEEWAEQTLYNRDENGDRIWTIFSRFGYPQEGDYQSVKGYGLHGNTNYTFSNRQQLTDNGLEFYYPKWANGTPDPSSIWSSHVYIIIKLKLNDPSIVNFQGTQRITIEITPPPDNPDTQPLGNGWYGGNKSNMWLINKDYWVAYYFKTPENGNWDNFNAPGNDVILAGLESGDSTISHHSFFNYAGGWDYNPNQYNSENLTTEVLYNNPTSITFTNANIQDPDDTYLLIRLNGYDNAEQSNNILYHRITLKSLKHELLPFQQDCNNADVPFYCPANDTTYDNYTACDTECANSCINACPNLPVDTPGCAYYNTSCGYDGEQNTCDVTKCFPFSNETFEQSTTGVGDCNCVCVEGNTGNPDVNPFIDACGQCYGSYLEEQYIENRADRGCGCYLDAPVLHFLDADNDAYIGNPYDGGEPNPTGEVNATVNYYFCLYENNNDITFAYDEIIEYDDSRGRTLLEPPNLTFNYPEYIPPMDNYVPDWVDLGNDFPDTFAPSNIGNIDLPGPEGWYNDGTFDTPAGEGGGIIISIGGCTDPEALNYNPAVDYDNGTCQYPTPPLAETNLPILQITGTDVKIYKSELDEQVTISPEFLIFEGSLGTQPGIEGMLQINTSYETFGNNNGNLNLPFSNLINLIPLINNYPETSEFNTIDDYTLSKTALTNNLFDIMGNKIVDFKFVDVEWDGIYFGTHLFYPEISIDVLGYDVDFSYKEPSVVITEIMHDASNNQNIGDYFVIQNRSGEGVDIAGWSVDGWASKQIILYPPPSYSNNPCYDVPAEDCPGSDDFNNPDNPYFLCFWSNYPSTGCRAGEGDYDINTIQTGLPTPYEAILLASLNPEIILESNDYIVFSRNPDDFDNVYQIPHCSDSNPVNCLYPFSGGISDDEKVILLDSNDNIIDEIDLNTFTNDENCTLMEDTSGTGNAIRIKHPLCPSNDCNSFVAAPPAGDEDYEPSFNSSEYQYIALDELESVESVCPLTEPSLFKFDNNEADGFVKIEGEDVDITNLTNLGNLNNPPPYEDFASIVNINSYLDYVLLQELRMGDGSSNNFNYDNVYVAYDTEKFNFGPFDFLEYTNGFINGFDVNFCQDEEYKVNATTNKSQGWLFDNIEPANLLSTQLKSFVLSDVFVNHLVTRWNELRGDVLSNENILQRIEYYFYYLKNRAEVNYQVNNYTLSTFKANIENLKTWITNRIYWMDHNIRRIKYQTEEPNPPCSGNLLSPTGITGNIGDFCNDPEANNYNLDSNFNDGTCEYDFLRLHEFILNTTDTSYPPIDSVRLNILSINNIEINVSYEMNETINNIWSYEYFDFMPGDIIKYNYTKQTPDVYNVATGPLETDKIRTLIIKDENQREIQNTFNNFINEFQETNLPIIKINTNTFNDMGFVDENNQNLFYCPSYELPGGYFADGPPEEICDMMKDYIDWHDAGKPVESEDFPEGNPGGYYTSKILCEVQTNCDVDCIDGTNIQDEPKIAGYFELIYNGEGAINNINDEPQLETRIGIEARGYSSRGFAKKQYALELQDMTKIFPQCDDENTSFGLFCDGFKPEPGVDYGDECLFNREDDFVLLGPFRDRTYMRNAITYELWERMGNIGTNSKFFEFILNDNYMGLYIMFEKPKIDRYRVPIDVEIDDNSSVNNGYDGGWMLKVESGAEQDFFVGYDSYTKYEYYDPNLEITGDEHDAETESARQKIQSTVRDFEERVSEYGEYPVSVPESCQGQHLVAESVPEACLGVVDCSQSEQCPTTEFMVNDYDTNTEMPGPLLIVSVPVCKNETVDCQGTMDCSVFNDTNGIVCNNHPECRWEVPFLNFNPETYDGEVQNICFNKRTPTNRNSAGRSLGQCQDAEDFENYPYSCLQHLFDCHEFYTSDLATSFPYFANQYGGYLLHNGRGCPTDIGCEIIEPQQQCMNNFVELTCQEYYDQEGTCPEDLNCVFQQESAAVYEDCQTYYDREGTCPEDCAFSEAIVVQPIEEYFELNNFVDYWLLQEFARNNEGYTRSQYWHSFGNASQYGPFDDEGLPIYDDNKIYLSFIWDMNHSFAATIVETDGWAIQNFFAVPQIWGNLFQQTWFAQAVYDRYVEIKNTIPIFDVGEINKLINKFSSELQQFNAVSRDQKRWFEGNVDEFNIYIKNLRKYILQRISWMDIHICPGEGQAFISSDEEHQLFYPTEGGFETCEEDTKNSNFVAIYNPFEGQVFDYDTLGNFIEIEIIVSLNLFRLLQQFETGNFVIRVTIQDELTNLNVEVFENIGRSYTAICPETSNTYSNLNECNISCESPCEEPAILIDNKGYVKLNWDISNLKQIDKLIGNYNITADIVGSPLSLDESIKRFSIQRVGKVSGCTDSFAVNYDLFAEVDDGSCKYLTDCNIKYGTSEFITDIIELAPGYNTISYPIDFSGTDLDLFNILNVSYYNADDDQPGNFQHNDYIIAFFNDGIYTATYMKDNNNQNGKWIKTTNKGFNLNEISKGMGFMIHVRDGGRIIWNIPREELRQ